MANTSQKSDIAQSVTQVSSLAGFVKWVNKIGGQNMLFRGLANAEWKVESSLYRRLKFSGLKNIDSDIFLEMTKVLIKRASKEGYDIENIPKLNDLELLSNLQHYGAATCLIDFTKHSLIALCFACESADNKTGKVVAFNSDNADLYKEISIGRTDKKIEDWLTEYIKNKKLFILSPKKRNNRIASQQSVFVFGSSTLPDENFYICEINTTKKEKILEELKKNGISVGMLFDDFVGFSALNSHNKKYENWDTDSDFVSGRICHASESYKSAIKYYDKAIKSDPKFYEAYNNRGNCKLKLKKYQEAISDYDEAIKLNPEYCIAYNNRGTTKSDLGDFQDAINDYNESIRLNPEYYVAYNNRGTAKNDLGNFQDAINDYNESIRLNPEYYVAYNNRGTAKNDLGNFQDAISDYDEVIRLNPNYSAAYNNRGNAKSDLGNFQDAISDYDEAIRLNPKDETYNNRGIAKKNLGKLQDAINDYNDAIRLNPKYSAAHNNRGNAKYNLGKFQDAISDYNDAIRLNPKYDNAYYNRGIAKSHLDKFQDAISDYDKAIKLNPENYETYYARGFAKIKLGDIKGAMVNFAKAKEINPEIEIPDLLFDTFDK